jgi:hypothetical protein
LGEGSDETQELLYDYVNEIEALSKNNQTPTEQKITFVTVFMTSRAQAQLEPDKWTQLNDWTEADTEEMPSKLLDQIFSLLIWERDGWPEPGKEPPAEGAPEAEMTALTTS